MHIGEPIDEQRHDLSGVAVDAERTQAVAVEFVAVGVDLDQVESCRAPLQQRELDARSDAQHEIDIGPHAVSEAHRSKQGIGLVEHAVTHPSGRHGRLQQFGELAHRWCGVLGACADPDQRVDCRAQLCRCGIDEVDIDRRHRPGPNADGAGRWFGPHVGRHLDRNWPRRPGDQLVEGILDLLRRHIGIADDRRVLGDLP